MGSAKKSAVFNRVCFVKYQERKHQAMMLVSDAESVQGPNYPETEVFHRMVSVFKSSLADFVSRAERCGEELGTMVYICHFCERVRLKVLFLSSHTLYIHQNINIHTLQHRNLTENSF